MALHSSLVSKPTLPVTSTPHILTLPLTANLSLSLPTPLCFCRQHIYGAVSLQSRQTISHNKPLLAAQPGWALPREQSAIHGFPKEALHSRKKNPTSPIRRAHARASTEGWKRRTAGTGGLVQPSMTSCTVSAQQQAYRQQRQEEPLADGQQGRARHLLQLLNKV